jgi:hypothetical protein
MNRCFVIAGLVTGLAAGAALADHHKMMGPPPGPEMVLSPPEGAEPPADMPPPSGDMEADKMAMLDMFFSLLDANGDNAADGYELGPWVRHVHMPPPPPGDGEMMEGDMMPPPKGEMMPPPPEGGMMPPPGDGEMMPPPHPEVVLGPPEGFMPPPDMPPPPPPSGDMEADKMAMLDGFIRLVDANGNGAIDRHEFHPWVRKFHMPKPDGPMMGGGGPMGEGGPMEGGPMIDAADAEFADLEVAPDCSGVVRDAELSPVQTNFACGDGGPTGNLVHRTVCNAPGGDTAISLPGGRMAGCFGLHAVRGQIGFRIVRENGGDLIWDMSMGKDAFRALVLEGMDPNEVYRIEPTGGSWDGAATVKFVDAPAGM